MSKDPRVPKTLNKKLADLEENLFLLHDALSKLASGQTPFFKTLAGQLRSLVCSSWGTEGLLWRLIEELNVPDIVGIHLAGNVKRDHPLARGVGLVFVPIFRAGLGDPKLPPALYSLKDIIKNNEALYISGKGVRHETLIKAVSQQLGSAHEDEGVEPYLAELSNVLLSDQQPFVQVLTMDASLVLEVGERLLDHAQEIGSYKRKYTFEPIPMSPVPPVLEANDLEHKSINEPSKEGSVVFEVTPPHSDWVINGNEYKLGMIQKGRLKVTPTKHQDGALEIVLEGLTDEAITTRKAIPHPTDNRVMIAVTWNESEINIYVNGQRVETVTR